MTKENYLMLKEELKEYANIIKNAKNNLKSCQRQYSSLEKEYGVFFQIYEKSFNSDYYKNAIAQMSEASKKTCTGYTTLKAAKLLYRHRHVLYCLARGKTLEQIEQKTKDNNKLNMTYLEELKEDYKFYEESVK